MSKYEAKCIVRNAVKKYGYPKDKKCLCSILKVIKMEHKNINAKVIKNEIREYLDE